jgi:hypothetical protein
VAAPTPRPAAKRQPAPALHAAKSVPSVLEPVERRSRHEAAALRAQGSADFSLVLAQLAVRLRPGFAPALALTADALVDQGHAEQALAVLSRIAADDPLAPVIGLRRADGGRELPDSMVELSVASRW